MQGEDANGYIATLVLLVAVAGEDPARHAARDVLEGGAQIQRVGVFATHARSIAIRRVGQRGRGGVQAAGPGHCA